MIHTAFPNPTSDALAAYLRKTRPSAPFYLFSRNTLTQTARRFQDGFDGVLTYAVKANDSMDVLQTLVDAGVTSFDVASVPEMRRVRECAPRATLHYNNPVRSAGEVKTAKALGVRSFSVDCLDSLERLGTLEAGTEISVRLHLPVEGARYDFGSKFGATSDVAETLLRRVAARGLTPSMTFHPGTQCERAEAWAHYIDACAEIATRAGVRLVRLNVGGGFPAHRTNLAPDLQHVFDTIHHRLNAAFGADAPTLVCEPGRAMVSEAYALVLQVKWRRPEDGAIFLNDGIYGALGEARDIGLGDRAQWASPDGASKCGPTQAAILFGPTCDSLDRIPETVPVPCDVTEGDYLIIPGMGAYSLTLTTQFNGYGTRKIVDDSAALSGHCARAS